VAAHQAVLDAEAERSRLIRLARARGASVREIAELLPVSFNTVFRWSGGRLEDGRSGALAVPLGDESR
jgi:transposase